MITALAVVGREGQVTDRIGDPLWMHPQHIKTFADRLRGNILICGHNTATHFAAHGGVWRDDIDLDVAVIIKELRQHYPKNHIIVCGGPFIWSRWFDYCDDVHLIMSSYEGDAKTYFPRIFKRRTVIE